MMKLLNILAVSFSITLLSGFVNAAPCTSESCGSVLKPSSGVRQYSAIGTKNWNKPAFQKPRKGWFKAEWNKVMATVVDKHSCALRDHYPALVTKIRWSDAYIDSRIKPTRAQARDPKWSNYIWNHPENGSEFVYDGISDALQDPLIDDGRGIAKLSVIVTLSATSDNLIPPEWVRKNKSFAWVEGTNSNGKSDNWHLRFDNPEVVDHAADFLAAFLAKYGNNKGLHSINLGEYFFGQKQYIPSGLNRDQYLVGVKNLWSKVVQAAPLDGNGQRVNIVQTNPLFNSQVSVSDLERIGVGMSESDTQIPLPVSKHPLTAALKKLYDGKEVHTMIDGDARYACQARRQSWDGTANPFGHKDGYSGVATPQEIFWYHGNRGPVPVNSIFMTLRSPCQTSANFIDAIKKFGACGTETSQWGAAPVVFSSNADKDDSIAQSKPEPPTVFVY